MNNLRLLNHDILFERTGKVLNIADPEIQNAITRHCINTRVKVLFIDNLSTAAFGLKENEADSWETMLPMLGYCTAGLGRQPVNMLCVPRSWSASP